MHANTPLAEAVLQVKPVTQVFVPKKGAWWDARIQAAPQVWEWGYLLAIGSSIVNMILPEPTPWIPGAGLLFMALYLLQFLLRSAPRALILDAQGMRLRYQLALVGRLSGLAFSHGGAAHPSLAFAV